VTWNPTHCGGYGPLPDSTATPLTDATQLAQATVWRGHRIDPTGFYYLGARYYEPTSGRFLSPDPKGQAASMSLYDFCNGDPVNNWDPDGRGPVEPQGQKACQLDTNNNGVQSSTDIGVGPNGSGGSWWMRAGNALLNEAQTDLSNLDYYVARPLEQAGAVPFELLAMANDKLMGSGIDLNAIPQIAPEVNLAEEIAAETNVVQKVATAEDTVTTVAKEIAPAAEPTIPSLVYRNGSAMPDNLTPRPGIDTTGLSTFDNLEAATPPGGKAQIIDTSKLSSLVANPDSPPPGHVSITPGDPAQLDEWAASRGTGGVHPLTQELMDAIVGTKKRPK
jgi:RHS repeat-associated protein